MNDNQNIQRLESSRFQVSEQSGEVLHQFRRELQKFVAAHPEIVGTAVYGSHVKGTARQESDPKGKSDVDAFVFIDEDVANLPPEPGLGVSDTEKSLNWGKMNGEVGGPFKEIFSKVANYDATAMKDIRFRLLSKGKIDTDLDAMANYLEKVRMSENGQGERPSLDERPVADIARMFHLQLGQGLDEYRAYVLAKLKEKGVLGDQVWETFFYEDTLAQENAKLVKGMGQDAADFQEARSKLFPHSIDEAASYFNLTETTPKY